MAPFPQLRPCRWIRNLARRCKVDKAYNYIFNKQTQLQKRGTAMSKTKRLPERNPGPKFMKLLIEIRESSESLSNMEEEALGQKNYLRDRQALHDEAQTDIALVMKDERAEHYPFMDNLLKQKQRSDEALGSALPKWKKVLAELQEERRRYRMLWSKLYALTQDYLDACLAAGFNSAWSCAPDQCWQVRVGRDIDFAIVASLGEIRKQKREVLVLKTQLWRSGTRSEKSFSIWPFVDGTRSQGAKQEGLRATLKIAEERLAALEDTLELRRMRQGLFEPSIVQAFGPTLVEYERHNSRKEPATMMPEPRDSHGPGEHENDSEHSRASSGSSHSSSDNGDEADEEYHQRLLEAYKDTEGDIEDLQNQLAEWHQHVRDEEIAFLVTFPNAKASTIETALLSTKKPLVDDIREAEERLVAIKTELATEGIDPPRSRGVSPAVSVETVPDDESVKKVQVRLKRRKLNRYRFASKPGRPSSRVSDRSQARFEHSYSRQESSPSMSPSPNRKRRLAEYKGHQKRLRGPSPSKGASSEKKAKEP